MEKKEYIIIALLILLSLFLFFFRLGDVGFFEPDEGRYAEIAREMIERGDYVVPRLNGVLYFEKPPLVYWLTALSFKVFGINEFAGRFVPAFFGFLGIIVTYFLARKMYGVKCALYSSLILLATIEYFIISRILVLDMALAFFVSCSFFCFYSYLNSNKNKTLFLMFFYAASALGVLTKGPVAVVLPWGICSLYVILTGRFIEVLKNKIHLWGMALFILIVSPWFILIIKKEPSFFRFFFIHEHITRFLTSEHERGEPFYYFLAILLIGFLPWIAYIPFSLKRYLKIYPFSALKNSENNKYLFLFLWAIGILGFFSISGSKLPAYIVPLYPALAVMVGKLMADETFHPVNKKMQTRVLFSLTSFLLLLFLMYCGWVIMKKPLLRQISLSIIFMTFVVALGLVSSGYLLFKKEKKDHSYLVLIFMMIALQMLLFLSLQKAEDFFSSKKIIMTLKSNKKPGDEVYCFGCYEQALPFYLEQRIKIINWKDELTFGADKLEGPEKNMWFIDADMDFLQRELEKERRVFIILKKGDFDTFIKRYPEWSNSLMETVHKTVLISNIKKHGSE